MRKPQFAPILELHLFFIPRTHSHFITTGSGDKCTPLLAVQHSSAVYFLWLIYVILDVLLEGYRGSCITEICTVIKMTSMLCELLAVKHGDLKLDLFSNSVLYVFIEFLCSN